MRTQPVRHFSRALHQVSVCLITSARHLQVRSPNMRTSQHIVAVRVQRSRRSYCPSKSWLTRTNLNATGRNDLQTAKTLIPRENHAADMPRYTSCTETQRLTNSNGISKLFFFLRCREQQAKQQQTSIVASWTCHAIRTGSGFYVQSVPYPCSLREEVCCLLGAMSLRTQTPRGGS